MIFPVTVKLILPKPIRYVVVLPLPIGVRPEELYPTFPRRLETLLQKSHLWTPWMKRKQDNSYSLFLPHYLPLLPLVLRTIRVSLVGAVALQRAHVEIYRTMLVVLRNRLLPPFRYLT